LAVKLTVGPAEKVFPSESEMEETPFEAEDNAIWTTKSRLVPLIAKEDETMGLNPVEKPLTAVTAAGEQITDEVGVIVAVGVIVGVGVEVATSMKSKLRSLASAVVQEPDPPLRTEV
jgi:hypothetical protein